jgi:hypothetical protein
MGLLRLPRGARRRINDEGDINLEYKAKAGFRVPQLKKKAATCFQVVKRERKL